MFPGVFNANLLCSFSPQSAKQLIKRLVSWELSPKSLVAPGLLTLGQWDSVH